MSVQAGDHSTRRIPDRPVLHASHAQPFVVPANITGTEIATYRASIMPTWRSSPAFIGEINMDGFSASNGIKPAYDTYTITLTPSMVVGRSGNQEFGSVSGTWSPGSSSGYHSFKETGGPDAAWATWSLARQQSSSAKYTRLDSRRIPDAPELSYTRVYQSWWETDGNWFNGAEPNGASVSLESAFFVGSTNMDNPYTSSPKSYYICDTGSINTVLSSSGVPLDGWDWTWDKDGPLFDDSGSAGTMPCVWQRAVSDTFPYPQIINDFTEIQATMVGSCTMNESISIDLDIAPGWRVINAELSLVNAWHPAGVAITCGAGDALATIAGASASTCTWFNVSRRDVTAFVANGSLDLRLSGNGYADIRSASTWQDTWLGALNCYLENGWIDVTVARDLPCPSILVPHVDGDPATRIEAGFSLSNLSSTFPATHVSSRQHETIVFDLHGIEASIESIHDEATNTSTANFSGLVSANGTTTRIDLRDGLHGWLDTLPRPVVLHGSWRFDHAPLASAAVGQVLDQRVFPDLSATTIVRLREFGTGDTACVDVALNMTAAGVASLPSSRVVLGLLLNGTLVTTAQVNGSAGTGMAQVRLVHAFAGDAPGHYQLEAVVACQGLDGSIATMDHVVVEPDLHVKSFPAGDAVVFPIAGGRKASYAITAGHVLLDPLLLDPGTACFHVDLPRCHGVPTVAFWNATIDAPPSSPAITSITDVSANRISIEASNGSLVNGRYELEFARPPIRARVHIDSLSGGSIVPYTAGARNDDAGGDITIAGAWTFERYFLNVSVTDALGNAPIVFELPAIMARVDVSRLVEGGAIALGSFPFLAGASSVLVPVEAISSFGGIDYAGRDINLHFAVAFNASQAIYDEHGTEIDYAMAVRHGIDVTASIESRFFGTGPCTIAGGTISMLAAQLAMAGQLTTITITSVDGTGRPIALRARFSITAASWSCVARNGTTMVIRQDSVADDTITIPGITSLLVPAFATSSLPGEPFIMHMGDFETNDSYVDLSFATARFACMLPGQSCPSMINGSSLLIDVLPRPVVNQNLHVSCPVENGLPTATPSIPISASVTCIDATTGTPEAGCWVEFLVDGLPVGLSISGQDGVARLDGIHVVSVGTSAIGARITRITSGQFIDPALGMAAITTVGSHVDAPGQDVSLSFSVRRSHVRLDAITMLQGLVDIPATSALGICACLVDLDLGSPVTGLPVSMLVNGTVIPGGVLSGSWWFVDASVPGMMVIEVAFAGDGTMEPAVARVSVHVHRVTMTMDTTVDRASPGENMVLSSRAWDELLQGLLHGLPIIFEARPVTDGLSQQWAWLGTRVTGVAGSCDISWAIPASLAGQLVECRARSCPAGAQASSLGFEQSPSTYITVGKIATTIDLVIAAGVNETTSAPVCIMIATLLSQKGLVAVPGAPMALTIYGRPAGFPAVVFLQQVNVTSGTTITIDTRGKDAIQVVATFAGNSSHAATIAETSRPCTIKTRVAIEGPATCIAGGNATWLASLLSTAGIAIAGQGVVIRIGAWRDGMLEPSRELRFTSAVNATRMDASFESAGIYAITGCFAGDGTFLATCTSVNITVVDPVSTRLVIEFPSGQDARVGVPLNITVRVAGDAGSSLAGAIIHVNIQNGAYYERVNVTLVDGVITSFTWIPREASNFSIEAWFEGNDTVMPAKLVSMIAVEMLQGGIVATFFCIAISLLLLAGIVSTRCKKRRVLNVSLLMSCVVPMNIAMHFTYPFLAKGDVSTPFHDVKADASALAGMAASMGNGLDCLPREAMAAVAPSLARAQPYIAAAIVQAGTQVASAGVALPGDGQEQDIAPPEIWIAEPVDGGTITDDALAITARVTDAGTGVARAWYQVFRAGSAAGAVLSGFLPCNETGSDPHVYQAIEDIGFFTDGEYMIVVNATDMAANNASASCRFVLDHEIFVPGDEGGAGDAGARLQFLAEMAGIVNVSFTAAIGGTFELAITGARGWHVIAPWIKPVVTGERVTVLVAIDPALFAEGNYTLSMTVYTANPYVTCHEAHELTVSRKAIVIDLRADGLEQGRDGAVAYTNHDIDLVAALAPAASQGSVAAPLPSGALGGKRVDFAIYINDTWVPAGFAVTGRDGAARLRFRFSSTFSWHGLSLGERARVVFNASFAGDAAFKPQAGQAIVDHRGIKTLVELLPASTASGAAVQASPGDVATLQARLVESATPGTARLVAGAPVDFYAVDPATGNRTFIGMNATAPGSGIATLGWIVNVRAGVLGIAAEFTGNATHAPSIATSASCMNVTLVGVAVSFAGLGTATVPVLPPGSITPVAVSVQALPVEIGGRPVPLRGAAVTLSAIVDGTGVAVEAGTAVTGVDGIARVLFDPAAVLGGSPVARGATLVASCAATASSRPGIVTARVVIAASGLRVAMDPVTIVHGSACTIAARLATDAGMPLANVPVVLLVSGNGHAALVNGTTTSDGAVTIDLPCAAWLDAGVYALTFTMAGNASIGGGGARSCTIAAGLAILPSVIRVELAVPGSLPAHEQVPATVRVVDEAGQPVIARVRVAVIDAATATTRGTGNGWTNASGEWTWTSPALPAGKYEIEATIDGDGRGNRLGASASVAVELLAIQADLAVVLASGDWLYPGDVARVVVKHISTSAPWSQLVPVDVAVTAAGVNVSCHAGTVLLEPGCPMAVLPWRVPAWWPTGDAVVEARIKESLTPCRGSATAVLHVRSRTALAMSVLLDNGTAIDAGVLAGGGARATIHALDGLAVAARLLEADGDLLGPAVALVNGTMMPIDATLTITYSPVAPFTLAVNSTGDVPAGTRLRACLARPDGTREAQWLRVSYAGDAYHDPAEVMVRFAVVKRPAALSIVNVTRGAAGLHAAARPACLLHRSDAITVTGTLVDAVNASLGVGGGGIAGAAVQVLVDGQVVAICTTGELGGFSGTFVPASFIGPTIHAVPSFCKAGYHVLSAAFAGDAAYLPNATTRDEALQVIEYMHVDLAVRATDMSWTASDLLFTITIRDEDFLVSTDTWLRVSIVQTQRKPDFCIESEKEVYAQYLTSGAYRLPVTSGGDFHVSLDCSGTWFDGLDPVDNTTLLCWSDVDAETDPGASCWLPDRDRLLANPPGSGNCTSAVTLVIVNLAIAWMPRELVTYARGLLTSAKLFSVKLSLRLMVFVLFWLLQENVYLPDLVTGLVAICVSWATIMAFKWFIQKVGTRIADAIVNKIVGPELGAEVRGAMNPAGSSSRPGSGGGTGGPGGSGSTGGPGGSGGASGGGSRGPEAAANAALRHASTLTGRLMLASCSLAGLFPAGLSSASQAGLAAMDLAMPGSQSCSNVKAEFSGMLSIMVVVELGLLSIGALVVTWQVVHEAERVDDLVEGYLIHCLMAGVTAAFFSMTIISQVLRQFPGGDVAGSVLIMFVLGIVVGMLIGTAIVEVLMLVITHVFKIDLDSLDFWARMLIQVMLELVRWSITLLVTYAFIASPGAIGSAVLISILRELVVSMLKALLFEIVFLSLEAIVNEGLKAFKLFPVQEEEDEQYTGLERVLEPGQVSEEDIRDFIAKYWKTIGQSIDVHYIMHGKKHLWEWIAPVITAYILTNNLSQKLNYVFNVEDIKEAVLAHIIGSINRGEHPEPYALLCGMLDLMAHGYIVVYARLTFLRLFDFDEVNQKGTTGSSCGPDIVAYKIENGQEVYAIVEAKQLDTDAANQVSWKAFKVREQVYWEASRDHLRMMNSRKDYLKTMGLYFPKAAEICEKIRKYSDLKYNVQYVIGSVFQRKDILVYSNKNQFSINNIKNSMANGGTFEIKLYELRNSRNDYPVTVPDVIGEPARSVVFDNYPHLKKLLD